MALDLTAAKALIFRITHRDNLPWILDHGLHCATSPVRDPGFVTIGSEEVIGKRISRPVPDPPGGTLADYVPFYFTPRSPMLFNITTGFSGVTRRPMDEIVVLVSSIPKLVACGLTFLFTDRHAIYSTATFFRDPGDVGRVPWDLLQAGDFRRDAEHPDRFERYQAEALVHRHVPLDALVGLACYNQAGKTMLTKELVTRGLDLNIRVVREYYFP